MHSINPLATAMGQNANEDTPLTQFTHDLGSKTRDYGGGVHKKGGDKRESVRNKTVGAEPGVKEGGERSEPQGRRGTRRVCLEEEGTVRRCLASRAVQAFRRKKKQV